MTLPAPLPPWPAPAPPPQLPLSPPPAPCPPDAPPYRIPRSPRPCAPGVSSWPPQPSPSSSSARRECSPEPRAPPGALGPAWLSSPRSSPGLPMVVGGGATLLPQDAPGVLGLGAGAGAGLGARWHCPPSPSVLTQTSPCAQAPPPPAAQVQHDAPPGARAGAWWPHAKRCAPPLET